MAKALRIGSPPVKARSAHSCAGAAHPPGLSARWWRRLEGAILPRWILWGAGGLCSGSISAAPRSPTPWVVRTVTLAGSGAARPSPRAILRPTWRAWWRTSGSCWPRRGSSRRTSAAWAFRCRGRSTPRRGGVLHPPNLPGWRDVPLRDCSRTPSGGRCSSRTTRTRRRSRSGASGRGAAATHLVYLTMSTGVGGGLVLGGRLQRGVAASRRRGRPRAGRVGRRALQLRAARLPRGLHGRRGLDAAPARRLAPADGARGAARRGRGARARPEHVVAAARAGDAFALARAGALQRLPRARARRDRVHASRRSASCSARSRPRRARRSASRRCASAVRSTSGPSWPSGSRSCPRRSASSCAAHAGIVVARARSSRLWTPLLTTSYVRAAGGVDRATGGVPRVTACERGRRAGAASAGRPRPRQRERLATQRVELASERLRRAAALARDLEDAVHRLLHRLAHARRGSRCSAGSSGSSR